LAARIYSVLIVIEQRKKIAMRIVLEGMKRAPNWVTISKLIRECDNSPEGHLTRINRVDRGVDYQACGEYDLEFNRMDISRETVVPIKLIVSGVGSTKFTITGPLFGKIRWLPKEKFNAANNYDERLYCQTEEDKAAFYAFVKELELLGLQYEAHTY
jgi:hypothetical protein